MVSLMVLEHFKNTSGKQADRWGPSGVTRFLIISSSGQEGALRMKLPLWGHGHGQDGDESALLHKLWQQRDRAGQIGPHHRGLVPLLPSPAGAGTFLEGVPRPCVSLHPGCTLKVCTMDHLPLTIRICPLEPHALWTLPTTHETNCSCPSPPVPWVYRVSELLLEYMALRMIPISCPESKWSGLAQDLSKLLRIRSLGNIEMAGVL